MGTSTKLLHEHNLQKSFMSSQKSSIRLSSKSVANSRKRVSAASVKKNNNNNNNNKTVIKTRSNAKQQLQNQLTEEPIAEKCKPKKSSTKNRSTAAVAKSMERGPSKRINSKSNNNDSSISLKNLNNNNQINKPNNNNYSSLNFDNISATAATATATTTKPSSNATTTTKSKSNQKPIERKIQTKTGRTKRKYLCDFCKKEFLGWKFDDHCSLMIERVIKQLNNSRWQRFAKTHTYPHGRTSFFLPTLWAEISSRRMLEKSHRIPAWHHTDIHMLLLRENVSNQRAPAAAYAFTFRRTAL